MSGQLPRSGPKPRIPDDPRDLRHLLASRRSQGGGDRERVPSGSPCLRSPLWRSAFLRGRGSPVQLGSRPYSRVRGPSPTASAGSSGAVVLSGGPLVSSPTPVGKFTDVHFCLLYLFHSRKTSRAFPAALF